MLERLHVHGFRTLFETEVHFDPLTIMIGKNGSGKTSILDALHAVGNLSPGGGAWGFGPAPWALAWQRSKGIGNIHAMRFDVVVRTETGPAYTYSLSLDERNNDAVVTDERLL